MDDRISQIIEQLLTHLQLPFSKVEKTEIAGQVVFNIQSSDARTIIGQRGDTVRAIDYLVKKIAEKEKIEPLTFLVDAGGYRMQKIKELQAKVLMMAQRAQSLQYDVELTPMSAYERLIVHTTLADVTGVKTESQGEGKDRRVVIRYQAV